jgi:protein required for attachment to host cells
MNLGLMCLIFVLGYLCALLVRQLAVKNSLYQKWKENREMIIGIMNVIRATMESITQNSNRPERYDNTIKKIDDAIHYLENLTPSSSEELVNSVAVTVGNTISKKVTGQATQNEVQIIDAVSQTLGAVATDISASMQDVTTQTLKRMLLDTREKGGII